MCQNQEKNNSFDYLLKSFSEKEQGIDFEGLSGSKKAYIAFRLYIKHKLPTLVIVPSVKESADFVNDLNYFFNGQNIPVMIFPQYNVSSKSVSYHNEIASDRIRTLYKAIESQIPPIIVTTPGALAGRLIPKNELLNFSELIAEGEEIERDRFIAKLVAGGYCRTAIVEEPGDYCIRGGIIDIFTPLYPDPLRIDLSDDFIESIRFFSAASQRSLKPVHEAIILPAKEAIIKANDLNYIVSHIRELASGLNIPVTKVRTIIDKIKNEGVLPEIEGLNCLVYSKPDSFFDYIPKNSIIIMDEPEQLKETTEKLFDKEQKDYSLARDEQRLSINPEKIYLSWNEIFKIINEKTYYSFRSIGFFSIDEHKRCSIKCSDFIKSNDLVIQDLKNRIKKENYLLPLAQWIDDKINLRCVTLIVCSTMSQAERIKSLLLPYGITPRIKENYTMSLGIKGETYICLGRISSGFVYLEESMAIITEDEIFGAKHHVQKQSARRPASMIIAFEDLKKGDLVVHNDHGIGQYEGIAKLTVDGSTNDFLLILYKDDDRLYLPVDKMNMVFKYMGVDEIVPVLDKMGGKAWDRVKERAKKSAEKIAGELLKLYATRKVNEGFAHKKPDSYFKDFEAEFSYEETPDQLSAIDDVMSDMENNTPMDRLVCGDVGYGKTEVALRASFLAINCAKQVAVLVPTTVLAEQHFSTFKARFEKYPVNIECLSRFRSIKEQKRIISDISSGKADIVIGTHRLLQKDVIFKDLGLIVLDEEHRFGVKHKEKLKKLRNNVDVLALTATPIPRTLHMSLTGIRDISVISTPPEHRQSIITYVSEFDEALIAEAVRKELARKGQIYFVHNNIFTIDKIANKLHELIPEIKIGIGHGRLSENELESVMLKFVNKDIDMLVCTTIIESGLDIPSANTIIINRADRFGLAQIYQLRGRVGRSDEQAYAYLFIPKDSILGKDAQKRLKVLMEHSDLGSGFQIAMSDLRIRGGGTILGASQSGHIAAIGYEMFLKLMEEAVCELKGEPVNKIIEPEINISMSAYLSELYVSDIDQRLTAYRRLSRMTELYEVSDFKAELEDRFGPLPKEASNLLVKIMFRILAQKSGIQRLNLKDRQLFLYFSQDSSIKNPSELINMVVSNKGRFEFTPDHVLKVNLMKHSFIRQIGEVKNILKEIVQRVNS
ncbi:transcription-repair coupling factor [Desulfobacterium sp. N47]|uniref:Transcription-repair-coupling factor n=1 Tax=uncultured Desulfobacterium sp. TaxID=201089 RepID=E1YBQ9_9BACT|nr:hypothetical protein N47_G33270 [uncultured Desulfobacterium sp.]